MPKEKVSLFHACGKAIEAFDAGKWDENHVADLLKGRRMLHQYICELASNDTLLPVLEGAMRDIHPQTPYGVDLLIRDLADICRTLKRLAENKRRSDGKKIADARMFFIALREELKSTL